MKLACTIAIVGKVGSTRYLVLNTYLTSSGERNKERLVIMRIPKAEIAPSLIRKERVALHCMMQGECTICTCEGK